MVPKSIVNKPVFIKTITLYYIGILDIEDDWIVLRKAAWIPVTGRWYNTLIKGISEISEIEPYPDDVPVYLNPDTLVEVIPWKHPLPRDQK